MKTAGAIWFWLFIGIPFLILLIAVFPGIIIAWILVLIIGVGAMILSDKMKAGNGTEKK